MKIQSLRQIHESVGRKPFKAKKVLGGLPGNPIFQIMEGGKTYQDLIDEGISKNPIPIGPTELNDKGFVGTLVYKDNGEKVCICAPDEEAYILHTDK